MLLFDKQGFADAKSIGNLLCPWFGSFLGMASACVVYGFALILLIFQFHFFFSDFFLGAFEQRGAGAELDNSTLHSLNS